MTLMDYLFPARVQLAGEDVVVVPRPAAPGAGWGGGA